MNGLPMNDSDDMIERQIDIAATAEQVWDW